MSAATIIALLIPFSAGAQPATHRLDAQTFSLSGDADQQSAIWSDRLPELRQRRQALQKDVPNGHFKFVAQVWTTTFSNAGRSYVVSAIDDDCESTSAAPNWRICPTRIAEVSSGKLRVIASITLPISSTFDASANTSSQFMTIAAFDPSSRTISFVDVTDGEKTSLPQRVNLQ